MRQVDGGNSEAAPTVSAYMPSYNTTTAGRLRRIRQQRGIAGASASSGVRMDGSSSSSAEAAVKLRRCPMLTDRGPSESRKQPAASMQPGTSQIQERSLTSGVSAILWTNATADSNKTRANNTDPNSNGRKKFLRPPNGAHVPPRLDGYEKYVQECIRCHREASSDRGNFKKTSSCQLFNDDKAARLDCSSNINRTRSEECNSPMRTHEYNSQLSDSITSFGVRGSVVPNGAGDALSKSTSALDAVWFVASSVEFEESSRSSTELAVNKDWNVFRKPAELVRPPRFGPGASIDEMRQAVSQARSSRLGWTRPPQESSIDSEYLANLATLRKLAAVSNASSLSSSFGLSLSLSAELRANQPSLRPSDSSGFHPKSESP